MPNNFLMAKSLLAQLQFSPTPPLPPPPPGPRPSPPFMPLTDPPRFPLAASTRARPPTGGGGGCVTRTHSHPSPVSPLSLCPPSDLAARPGGVGTHRHPQARTDTQTHTPSPARTRWGLVCVEVGTFWPSPLRWAPGVGGRGPAGLWVVRIAAVLHTHAHFSTPKPTE